MKNNQKLNIQNNDQCEALKRAFHHFQLAKIYVLQ